MMVGGGIVYPNPNCFIETFSSELLTPSILSPVTDGMLSSA